MENLQSTGILDLIFIAILLISVIVGLTRGVIREILSLTGLVASIYLAFTFSEKLSKSLISKFINNEEISYLLSFAIIIIGTLFFITLINLFLSSLLKASGLSFINRIFGAIFGVIRGAIICSILVTVAGLIPDVPKHPSWKESSLVPFFQRLTHKTFEHIPDNVRHYIENAATGAKRAASEVLSPNNNGTEAMPEINLESFESSHQDDINNTTARPQTATSQQGN